MAVAIAVLLGLTILGIGVWVVQLLATPPPPEPDPDDVVAVTADYRCTVCGLRLTVTHAHGGEFPAPKHCREEMEPA